MPRTPRVEYENAVYHVMARGERREPIVFEDGDCELFLDTFADAEACGRTGWQVFVWVLLDNHYHAVFRTPEPNLVAGMQWFHHGIRYQCANLDYSLVGPRVLPPVTQSSGGAIPQPGWSLRKRTQRASR